MVQFRRILSLFAAVAVTPVFARAQDAGNGFLFGPPSAMLALRGGWAIARAKSDLFSYTTELLTLKRGDFSSPDLVADVAFRVTDRTQIVVSGGVSGMDRESEFRNFIDNNDKPIEQTTSFRRVPVTIGVKRYLTSPGRSIGRFAWIPSRVAPYVGAGAGMMWYRFRQAGDFINFETTDVFSSTLDSQGWTKTANVLAGVEYSLGSVFALTSEARYGWAKAGLSSDFSGFERVDLSGLSTTVGLAVRF
jgi:hypothetical protein